MSKEALPPYLRPGIDDVQRMDESGEVDVGQIRYNLSLTVEQRFEQYFAWMEFVEAVREGGRERYGAELWEKMREGWRIELLKKLVEHDVRFVVIGGVAAIAHGSARVTEDLDVFAPVDHENAAAGRPKDRVALRELEVIRDLKRNADGDQE